MGKEMSFDGKSVQENHRGRPNPEEDKKRFFWKPVRELLVQSYAGHRGNAAYWRCLCKCGRQSIVRMSCLQSGVNKTCGECPKPHNSKHHAWKGVGELSKNLFNTYRHGAIEREIEFDITIEQAWSIFELQGGRCAMTGWPIKFNETYKGQKEKTASLDRIDSSRGYVTGNLQWVHRDINNLKKNWDLGRFIEMCTAIANYAKVHHGQPCPKAHESPRQALSEQSGRCFYCGRQVRRKDATVEHIIPRCAGGTNNRLNLAMACKQCNNAKSVEDQKYRIVKIKDCLTNRLVFARGDWFSIDVI